VGISLSSISEGCCDYLNSLDTIDFDEYKKDKSISSVDRILECKDKYIFIEEKSFILDYFRLAGQKSKSKFVPMDGEISDDFLEKISTLDIEVKQQLFYKAMAEKTLSSVDKVKDTVFALSKDDDFYDEKVKKSNTIYLYCKSNTHADKLANIVFNAQSKKDKIIECDRLERFLQITNCN